MPQVMDERMRQDMVEAASMAVAIAASEKAIAEQKVPKTTPWKVPPPQVRAVVLVQSCLRRKAFFRSFGAAALEDEELRALAPPDPLVAVALYMCRRMRNPKFVNVDVEAKAVAGIAVGKDDVTMDVLANIVWFYEDNITDSHPAMITLRERLHGLVIYAHEVLQKKLQECNIPVEVHAEIEYARKTFRVLPELAPQVFSCAEPRMKEVVHDAETVMEREIKKCITTLEYEQTAVELERIFGPVETQLREKLSVAHMRRVQYLERELETRWSRPFAGPLPPHSRAAQRYIIELGMVPSVVAFLKEEKNHAARLEAQLEVELHEFQGILKNLAARRKEAKARSLIQDLESKISDETVKLQQCIERALVNLGPDNKKVCQKARILLSNGAHTSVFAMFAENLAEELRTELEVNDPAPEAADRRRGIALSISAALDELNPDHVFQKELREEFDEEIQTALASQASPPLGVGLEARPKSAEEPYGEPPLESEQARNKTQLPSKQQAQGVRSRELPMDSETTEPARAWGTGPLATSLSGNVPASEGAGDGIMRTNERPRSPGEATVDEPEEEDLWFTPVGFEDLKSRDEKVQPKDKFAIPGAADGPPLKEGEHQVTTASPETVMMMQSFDAESLARAKEPINNGVTAQLTLEDLTMDVVHLHTEAVFATKFRRAIADACGVPMERIKIVGFEHGSVKVLMTISEPLPDEQPTALAGERAPGERRRGAKQEGPKTAKEVLDELTKQIADPSSRLRLGEVGPYVTSAVLERGVAARSLPVEQHSLASAYMAPPLGTEKPESRTLAWTGTTQAGDTMMRTEGADSTAYGWGKATGYPGSTMPTMQVLADAASPSSPEMLQSSTMMKSASERTFRTTCPRDPLTHEEQTSSWASPYEPQPMYALYHKTPEEIHPRAFDGAELKTKPQKEKFTMHATFCVTRHPMCGTEKFKGLTAPQSPTIAAANSWLEATEGELQEAGMPPVDWPELGDLAEKGKLVLGVGKDGTQSEAGDVDDDMSPVSASEGGPKKGRKGRKKLSAKGDKTKSRDLQEPEPETGMESTASSPKASEAENDVEASPASASPASTQPKKTKKGAKKADKAAKETTPGDTTDATEDPTDIESAQEGEKRKKEQRPKKKASAKTKDLKPVFEEGKDPASTATRSPRSPRNSKERQEEKSDNEEVAGKRRGRLRPPAVETQRGGSSPTSPKTPVKTPSKASQRPASEGSRELSMNSFDTGASNSRYAGMLGGIPGTGVRHQVDDPDQKTRLPELVGKPSTDDLRTPAFMYSWFRHSTVGVGPPYRTTEKDHEENPAWTAMRMLDESLDKNDWNRSYAWSSRKIGKAHQEWAFRGAQLGPERSIRQTLGRSRSAGARDRLPPVKGRGGRQRPPRDHGKPEQQRPSPTPKPQVQKPTTSETPDVVIIPADERPSSSERPTSQGSGPTEGTAVADVIEVTDLAPSETTQSESERPKDLKPKAEGKKKRTKVELRQREEKPEETEEERQAKLAAEEEKKAAAKAEQKKKKTEEKNKKAKDRLDKEKRDKAQHDKDETDRLQREKDDEEAARLQAEEDKENKEKRRKEKKKKDEEEAIKKNQEKRKRERGEAPDMTGFDPHELDETLNAAKHDVLDQHGHLDVPEGNATSRSSSKTPGKRGDKEKGKKTKKPKSKASSSNATTPTPSPTSTKDDDTSRPGSSGTMPAATMEEDERLSGNIAAGLNDSLESGELAAFLDSCKDEQVKQDVAAALNDSLNSGELAALLSDNRSEGPLSRPLSRQRSSSKPSSLASTVEVDTLTEAHPPPVSGTALADAIDVAEFSTKDGPSEPPKGPPEPPKKPSEVGEPLSAPSKSAPPLTAPRTFDEESSQGAMSKSAAPPVAPPGALTPPSLTIKLDFFAPEDRPETRSPSMFSRMDTPTSCNTTLHNFGFGGAGMTSGRGSSVGAEVVAETLETTEAGVQTSAPSSRDGSKQTSKVDVPEKPSESPPLTKDKEQRETTSDAEADGDDTRVEEAAPLQPTLVETPVATTETSTADETITDSGKQAEPLQPTSVETPVAITETAIASETITDSGKQAEPLQPTSVETPVATTETAIANETITDSGKQAEPLQPTSVETPVATTETATAAETNTDSGKQAAEFDSELTKKVADLEKQLAEARQHLADTESRMSEQAGEFESELSRRAAHVADLEKQLGEARQRLAEAETKLTEQAQQQQPTPTETPVAPSGTAVADEIIVANTEAPTATREGSRSPGDSESGYGKSAPPPLQGPLSRRSPSKPSSLASTVEIDMLTEVPTDIGEASDLVQSVLQNATMAVPETPFPLSPSVGAWLQRAPSPVHRRLLTIQSNEEDASEQLAVVEEDERPLCQSPSAASWLREAPSQAVSNLRRFDEAPDSGTAVADRKQAATSFPLSPSVGWLQSKPARGFLVAQLEALEQDVREPEPEEVATLVKEESPVVESADQLSGDFRPLPQSLLASLYSRFKAKAAEASKDTLSAKPASGDFRLAPPLFDSIHALFKVKIDDKVGEDTLSAKPTLGDFRLAPSLFDPIHALFKVKTDDKVGEDREELRPPIEEVRKPVEEVRPPIEEVRPSSPEIQGKEKTIRPEARFRTNAGATREQVMNFAQSLTSSIFRTSNSIAMQRAASQPQMRRTVPVGSGFAVTTVSPAVGPTPGISGTRTASFSPPRPREGANASSSFSPPPQRGGEMRPRPKLEKKLSAIPTEEGAFFD